MPSPEQPIIAYTREEVSKVTGKDMCLWGPGFIRTSEGNGVIYCPQDYPSSYAIKSLVDISFDHLYLQKDHIESFINLASPHIPNHVISALRQAKEQRGSDEEDSELAVPITHEFTQHILKNMKDYAQYVPPYTTRNLKEKLLICPTEDDLWIPLLSNQVTKGSIRIFMVQRAMEASQFYDLERVMDHEYTHFKQHQRAKNSPHNYEQTETLALQAKRKYSMELGSKGNTTAIATPDETRWSSILDKQLYEIEALKECEAIFIQFQGIRRDNKTEISQFLFITAPFFRVHFYNRTDKLEPMAEGKYFIQGMIDDVHTFGRHMEPHGLGALILLFGEEILSEFPDQNFDLTKIVENSVSPDQQINTQNIVQKIAENVMSTYENPSPLLARLNDEKFRQMVITRCMKAREILHQSIENARHEAPRLFEPIINDPLKH